MSEKTPEIQEFFYKREKKNLKYTFIAFNVK